MDSKGGTLRSHEDPREKKTEELICPETFLEKLLLRNFSLRIGMLELKEENNSRVPIHIRTKI